ncbi:MAG TPA: LysR family transcriptional regulator [Segeticoccus sp.]|uniref:LysR family transcriptional regulator n=1 Tax=Segeticoccus sp. TaxID=2706531 RepID=UPI002D7EDCF0|nr:LysR family transcriptional regulator [Segeticoccus sp.]HET8600858.1 LysR family transcriptional regulator [Segeticoccus sp.]
MSDRPGPVELRYLVALAAIGRERSFSKAAESLGYTQSAISQQIGRLERLVGHVLVERPGGPKSVTLTPAGQLLLTHADAIVARLASAQADLRALSDGESGILRVGSYQSVGVRILPRLLREFAEAWPKVRVELVEAADDLELLDLVERGELDLTFVVYPLTPGPFEHVELLEDPYVVVVRDDSDLGRDGDPVHPSQLDGIPLITYARMRDVHAIEHRLGHPELAEQVRFRSHDNGTMLGLVAEGVGAAVISWLSVDPFRTGIRAVPLAGVQPRVVGLAWHRDRYRIPAAHAFVRKAREVAALALPDPAEALGTGT